jgi:hypothetical protein
VSTRLPQRCVTFAIDHIRRRAHLQLTTISVSVPQVRADIIAVLAADGVDIVAPPDTASLVFDVSLRVSPGTDMGGVCFTFIDVDLVVTDGGDPIHATTATRVSGAGLTCGASLHTPATRLSEATACGRRVRVHVAPRRQVASGGKTS